MRDLVNNEWYHVYNRGVEKRRIFLDNEDYARFLFHLYECNNFVTLPDTAFKKRIKEVNFSSDNRDRLVDVAAFTLMPNHFHILVRSIKDGSISDFMQRISVAYTKGFNKKYQRVGALFQGPYKVKLADKGAHLQHVLVYILTNALNLYKSDWKERGIDNIKEAKRFLENYKYSSYRSAMGGKDAFNFVTDRGSLSDIMESYKDLEILINDILGGELSDIDLALFGNKL
ncbi:MAG: transposase [Candidatus Niyogibacteria bacterium]|nr:transposase [Candidatus Niyogibacteria bacterium]